jgi:D-glycero-D-manno-heptose 1,7-bisphosphate phosphatase
VDGLKRAGWLVFVITNQPDVARGFLSREELDRMTATLQSSLAPHEIAVCPHDDSGNCACRKPKPGMLLDLKDRWNLDLERSFVIGDTWRDMEAGRRARCRTIFLERDKHISEAVSAHARIHSLSEALPLIGTCETETT